MKILRFLGIAICNHDIFSEIKNFLRPCLQHSAGQLNINYYLADRKVQ